MFVFEWLITRIAPEPAQAGAIQGMLQFLPAEFVSILGSEFTGNFSARGIIGFGWVHPFCLLMMAFWSVRLTAGALAGEIGLGTMDLLASRPVRRSAMVMQAFLMLIAGLAAVVLSGFAGTAIGLATRPTLGLAATAYLPVAGGCWLLFTAFGSVGLLMSAIRRHGGVAGARLPRPLVAAYHGDAPAVAVHVLRAAADPGGRLGRLQPAASRGGGGRRRHGGDRAVRTEGPVIELHQCNSDSRQAPRIASTVDTVAVRPVVCRRHRATPGGARVTFSEAETRAKLIDPALHAEGWTEEHIHREVTAGAVAIREEDNAVLPRRKGVR
jgi:hypothetical protein